MIKSHRFSVVDEGLSTQQIRFTWDGEEPIFVPIPDMELPEDQSARFSLLIQKLVDASVLEEVPGALRTTAPA